MGSGLVVGFPSNLRTVYVDQLQTLQTAGASLSLADSVMAADKEFAAWWRHLRLLQVSPLYMTYSLPTSSFNTHRPCECSPPPSPQSYRRTAEAILFLADIV